MKDKLTNKQLEQMLNKASSNISEISENEKGWGQKAHAFAISADGFLRQLASYGDVYELLNCVADEHSLADNEVGVVCETRGWASPVSEDDEGNELAPSQHPQRRRVSLICLALITQQMASLLAFDDAPDQNQVDFGSAEGTLADALTETLMKMVVKQN